jgi:hypothetical protein
MFTIYQRRLRLFGTFLLALVFATAAYGFANANTVPVSGAGDGQGAITGYTISAITYTLNAANPRNLDQVQFTLTPNAAGALDPTSVKIEITSGAASTWHDCAVAGTTATCDLTVATSGTVPVTALAATQLRVVAAQ